MVGGRQRGKVGVKLAKTDGECGWGGCMLQWARQYHNNRNGRKGVDVLNLPLGQI